MAANLDAFVSYSRRDGAFVAQLKEALEARGRNVWIDADDIPAGAPWRQELGTGIEAADAFVFVISPDSVVSPECLQELGRATELGKRLVPVLFKATTSVPPALAALQYVDVAQNRDLALSVAEIDAAIETDHEWVRAHTEWLARALRWQAGGRDDSALLRGSELDAAEHWLAGRKNGKQPPPTDLQTSFILSGRRSERRRLRLLVGLSLAAVAVSLGLAVLALVARNDAIEQRDVANEQRNQALSRELAARATDELDSDPGRSLRLALRAAETARTGPAEAALQGALTRPHPRLALETRSPTAASAVTPDGRHAVTVHRDGLGRVWELSNGRRLAVLRGHTAPITSVEISSDGRLAVTASALRSGERRDGTARIWELPSGRLLHELPHDAGGVETAEFDPAGRRVVTTPDFDALDPAAVWDARSGRRLFGIGAARFAIWSPGGDRIATIGDDGVAVRAARPGAPPRPIPVGADAFTEDLAFSPDGQRLAVAGDGVGLVAELAGGQVTRLPGRHDFDNALTSVRFCPGGGCVVTASADDTAQVWSLRGGRPTTLRGHTADVRAAGLSGDGRYVLTESADRTVRLWSRRSGAQLAVLRGHDGDITGAHFLAGGERILTSSGDGSARVWDPGVSVLDGHRDAISDARFGPGGRTVATASWDGTAKLWSDADGAPVTLERNDGSPLDSVDFSPDGRRVLTVQGETATLWTPDGERVRSLAFGGGRPAFSPDSKLLAAPASDALQLHDGRDGALIRTRGVGARDDRRTAVFDPAFSTGGSLVAAPGALTGAHLWSVRRGGGSLDLLTRERIDQLAFSPDGRELATAGESARVLRIWDVNMRRNLVLGVYPTGVRDLEFSPDGRLIASVSAGQRVGARSEPRQRTPGGGAAPRERGADGELLTGRAARAVGGQRRPGPPVGRPLGPPDRRPGRPRRRPRRGPLQPRRALHRHGG